MKKILYIQNAVFELPEDFNGGITEALKEFCKYFTEKSKEVKIAEAVEDNLEYLEGKKDKFSGTIVLSINQGGKWVNKTIIKDEEK